MRRTAVPALVLAAFLIASGAHANSSGAPTAADNAGCTCHNDTPSDGITVSVDGLPEAFEPGSTYDLTLTVSGGVSPPGASNVAGFLILVDVGVLNALDDAVQATSETRLTHTSAGNDQNSWTFSWDAPTAAVGAQEASFWWAGNAVNGDGTSAAGLDNWNMGSAVIPASGNGSVPDNTTDMPDNGTVVSDPGFEAAAAAVGLSAVALVMARRRRA